MKKIVTLLFTVLITAAAFAQNLPEFTEADNAYVFDAKKLKEDFGDGCKIVNLSYEENLSFDVYIMKSNKKNWILAGSGTVSGILDSCFIDSEYNGDFEKYRYFAIVPKVKKDYSINFTWDNTFMYAFNKEVCVFLVNIPSETPAKYRNNSSIVDVNSVPGKFKDNVKLINKSKDSNMDFLIFGFDDPESKSWDAVGKSDLKGYDDEDFIETAINDSSNTKKYAYYAVYALNGKKYELKASKAHNDLYIEVK